MSSDVKSLCVRSTARPHLPRIDEENLSASIPKSVVLLVPCQEPKARRDLRGVEKLPRQSNHAIDKIGFDDFPTDLPFTRLVR